MAKDVQTEQPAREQQTGIFEPKPVGAVGLPLSGTQKAIRFCIFIGILILIAVIVYVLHNPFMRPVKRYYKALMKGDAAAMCDAFPSWLTGADTDEETMRIYDMCAMVVTATNYNYGSDAKIEVKYASKTEVGADYLNQLETGIQSQYSVDVNITAGWWVTLDVTYTDGEDSVTVTEYARLYRINGRWTMLDVPGSTA